MNNTVKTLLKAAVGGAAAYLTVGEIAYESVLNIGFTRKLGTVINMADKDMMDVLLNHPVYTSSYEWYDVIDFADHIIVDADGKNVHAYILEQDEYTDKWAFCMHGYTGDPRAEAPFAKYFYEHGYNVLFPHMRAHEKDENRYCSMGFHDKNIILAWISYVVGKDPNCRILLHGTSMGAATTMLVTGEAIPENVKCAVADCGYSTCYGEFRSQLGAVPTVIAAPMIAMMNTVSKLRGNLDIMKCRPVDAVKNSKTPTLFIHGTGDTVVPYPMVNELFDACAAEKDRFDVEGAVHTGAVATDPEGYFAKLDAFTAKYMK